MAGSKRFYLVRHSYSRKRNHLNARVTATWRSHHTKIFLLELSSSYTWYSYNNINKESGMFSIPRIRWNLNFFALCWIKSVRCFDLHTKRREKEECMLRFKFISLFALFSFRQVRKSCSLPHSVIFFFFPKYPPLRCQVVVQSNQDWKLGCFCFISLAWVILSNTRMPLGKTRRKWCNSLWSLFLHFGIFVFNSSSNVFVF